MSEDTSWVIDYEGTRYVFINYGDDVPGQGWPFPLQLISDFEEDEE